MSPTKSVYMLAGLYAALFLAGARRLRQRLSRRPRALRLLSPDRPA